MEPYSFIHMSETKFFGEGADLPGASSDLLSFSFDDSDGLEMLGSIVEDARRVLVDTPTGFASALLRFGDLLLVERLEHEKTLISDKSAGEIIAKDELKFDELNQIELLPIVLHLFSEKEFVIGDEELGLPGVRITPEMFCASFVLRMALNVKCCMWDGELKNYYLMQASAAFGVMQSFIPLKDFSISSVVASSMRKVAAKRSASSRWSRLDDTKELAFKRRKEYEGLSRSAAIDKFLPEVIKASRIAGEPLTGGDPKRTVTDWFRKAGIK